MSIAIPATRQVLAAAYVAQGAYLGLATAAPGNTATPASEASGGSYARMPTTWTSGSGGVENGSATTIAANAAVYDYAILASAATGNTMIDNAAITSTTLSAPGQIVLTPTFTQT